MKSIGLGVNEKNRFLKTELWNKLYPLWMIVSTILS